MNSLLRGGLCMAVLLLLTPTVLGTEECVEGSVFMEDCNRCVCIDGRKACTLMSCNGRRPRQSSTCVDGSRWLARDGCNWCSCRGGVPACTRRACLTPVNIGRSLDGDEPVQTAVVTAETSDPSNRECEADGESPGRWRKDCNWCSCNSNGRGVCTRRACLPQGEEALRSQPDCEGTIRWKRNCNWCHCTEGRGVCTLKACFNREDIPALQERTEQAAVATVETSDSSNRECVVDGESPGRWRKDCNWCTCNSNGRGVCTRRACLPQGEEALRSQPDCEGTIRWKRNCNWCHCTEGRGVCTLKACFNRIDIPALQERTEQAAVATAETSDSSNRECVADGESPGRWRKDCNWCSCNNGRGVCTRRACLPQGEEALRSQPDCEGTIRWKRNCNWCHCTEGRGVCTEKACFGPQGGGQ